MRPALGFILGLFCASIAFAEGVQPTRTLRLFDFEERAKGNPEEIPMHWLKLEGSGLPHYLNGHLTADRAHGGKYSFRLDLNGGGLIYRYDPRQIKIRPGAHYRVEGFVQTTVLPHARARISAGFMDQDGHLIPDTVRHSDLYAAQAEELGWKSLSVELTADVKGTALLVVELELIQPMHYAPKTLGSRNPYPQDIRGSAWFDDVSVSQIPQVAISTDRPGNIFRRSEEPRLNIVINDRFTEDLAMQFVVRDAAGRAVYQRSGGSDIAAAPQVSEGIRRLSLSIPQLPAGWYQADLVITSQGQVVSRQLLDLVHLADDSAGATPDKRFGVIATDLAFEGWNELPELLPYLSAGRVKLAVWSKAGDIEQIDKAGFDQFLLRLGELGITPTACLVDLPPDLGGREGEQSWPQILNDNNNAWQPRLAYMVSRHANHLDRWQLGADGSDAFATQGEMRQVYQRIFDQFAKLVKSPDLAMPWPAWCDIDGELPATVALSVPPSVLPSQIPLYIQDLHGRNNHNLSLSLQLLDRAQYGRELQIRDLSQRMIYALAAGAERIDMPLPFTVRREEGRLVKQPHEMLLIQRTLTTVLAGTTCKGRMPLAEGIEAFLFDRNGQGILALWDRGREGGMKQLALNVGAGATRMDLWGNVTPLIRPREDSSASHVRLNVGTMPVFLMGIDAQQAQLRASIAFDQPLLESSFKSHTRRLRFLNPYRQAISGSFRLKGSEGWIITPASMNFSVNPGEAFDREITIEFPYNSVAGVKTVLAEFLVQADRDFSFTAPLTLHLGLSDVGMQTLALRDGNDVVVQQMITNYGTRPIDYTASAVYSGQARQERLVTGLAAGRTTVKRYRFTNVEFNADVRVRCGLREISGTRILNDEVGIQ